MSHITKFLKYIGLINDETSPPPDISAQPIVPEAAQIPEIVTGVNYLDYLVYGSQIVLVLVIVCPALFYLIKYSFQYIKARAYAASITFYNEKNLLVGETITAKLTFTRVQDNGNESICEGPEISLINADLIIQFQYQNKEVQNYVDVGVLRSFNQNKDGLLIRFSLRKSGQYSMSCLCGHFNFISSPLKFEVLPSAICLRKTIFNVPNPEIICVTLDQWTPITILPQDRYGNTCVMEKEYVNKFQIKLKQGNNVVESSSELEWEFCQEEGEMFMLKLRAFDDTIHKCFMTYDGTPIATNTHSLYFLVVTLTPVEEQRFSSDMASYFSTVPGSSKGTLLSVGPVRQEPTDVWISVSYKHVTISSLVLKMIYYPFLVFYINRRTKIHLVGPYETITETDENENEPVTTIKVSDGIQESVTVALSMSNARIFLASFGHFKGHKLKPISFEEKKSVVVSEIGSLFKNVRLPYQIILDPIDLLTSSLEKSPKNQSDWLKPFAISVYKSQNESTPFPVDKWLTLLLDRIFYNRKNKGLFIKEKDSLRLHPNLESRRESLWTNSEMEFAGSLVAKCVFDSINFGVCLNLTKLKFTKSFLNSLIGIPVTYENFESDYPNLWNQHVIPILESEEEEFPFYFETPKDFEKPSKEEEQTQVNLIPNGNNIQVTQRNKLYYLNLLALHILSTRHDESIQAFRLGFYKIIPQGLVADFDVNEFEKLICGGGCSFNFEDIKANHRVVADIEHNGLSDTDLPRFNLSVTEQKKLIRWFWNVLKNMTAEEHERLVNLFTGSTALPSCGFKELKPKFTISLTEGYNQPPKYYANSHTISIGNYSCFEKFERDLLASLYKESELETINSTKETDSGTAFGGDSSADVEVTTWIRSLGQQITESCSIM